MPYEKERPPTIKTEVRILFFALTQDKPNESEQIYRGKHIEHVWMTNDLVSQQS